MPDRWSQKLIAARPRKSVVLAVAFAALAGVMIADYFTKYELGLSPLYVIVILGVSWFCGWWWGLLIVGLSVVSQAELGLVYGHRFSEPYYLYVSSGNKLFSYLVIALLTSTAKTLYVRANAAARMDYLTGITNGLGFYEKVSIEMARHRRSREAFAVAYIDCDHFKVVNDGLGHTEGDRVLKTIGKTLKANSRETDIVARLGGDEFALVLPMTGEFEALQAIKKLRPELDRAMSENHWPITFSIGVGIFPTVPDNVDRVVAFTDKLMYRVKAMGKNKVLHRVYNPDEPETSPPPRDEVRATR
jgi:diguanylate cyclase (GGDEF)-like protein